MAMVFLYLAGVEGISDLVAMYEDKGCVTITYTPHNTYINIIRLASRTLLQGVH